MMDNANKMNPNKTFSLPEKLKVVISAGAGGIGLSLSEALYELGYELAIFDVDGDAIKIAKEKMPLALIEKVDVSKFEDVQNFFQKVSNRFLTLDLLINNAGIAGPTAKVEEIDFSDWKKCIDVCLSGQFLCTHFAVPLIKKNKGGSIINMSSAAGKFGYAFRTPYSSAKFGVIGLTQSLSKELGPSNIRVNALLPGIVEGERMNRVIAARAEKENILFEEMKERYLNSISMRKMVTNEDIVGIVLFLNSRAGCHISGQSIPVDAGLEYL